MFLTDRQVAARYSVSKATVWRWVQDLAGFPPPVKLSPGCTRWRAVDLDSFELNPAALTEAVQPKGRGRPRKSLAKVRP